MGVPALFRWLSQKYPKIVSPVIEEVPEILDGQEVPVDTTKPNPNGEEMDNLYLDMNGIVHPCTHPENRPPPETEEEMMLEVFKYTDRVVNMVRPRKLLMIAVDGVAPRAKMNQQRSRRFRSARDAKEKADETAEFIKLLEKQGTTFEDAIKNKKMWDSNAITPGTPFMDILALSLRYWCAYKLNTDPMWAQMKVIISDSTVPGEGEHKIMEFIRSQRADPEHDPNTRHVIYGLDADLIMLGLATHEPHFRVLREDVFLNEGRVKSCDLCGQKGHRREECTGKVKEKQGEFDEKSQHQKLKPFIWLHVEIFREYLAIELDIPGQGFKLDLERAIDDWVFLCFFVGNDFLPHLPSLEIRDGGIDTLIQIWKDNLPAMGGYITKDGDVNLERAQYILDGLAKQEDAIFRRRRDAEERREANAKRRRLNEQRNGPNDAPNGGPNGGGYTGLSYQNAIYKKPTSGPTPIPTPTDTTIPVPKNRKINPESIPHPDIPLIKAGDTSKATRKLNHDMILHRDEIRKANLENKSAAAALRASLLSGKSAAPEPTPETPLVDHTQEKEDLPPSPVVPSKRKADESPKPELIPDVSLEAEGHPDTVRLWEPGYADRYYEQKFKVDKTDYEFRRKVAAHYVEGLCWVLKYYFQGCPSWTWYYPYHYAPFAADFKDMGKLDIKFEKGKPFKPFEQLMGVLPAASKHNLPEPFQKLMTDEDSEIIDFYPEEFPIDMNGKKMSWQGVALLPFIDEQRLLEAAQKIYPQLTSADAARNALGHDVLLISDENPIYNDVVDRFYSKKKDHTKYKIKPKNSAGLSGTVVKDPLYIPRSTHSCPLSVGEMPDLHDDRSMSLQYKMPKSKNIHKSMLLNGVKFNPPVLTRADIETTRARAQSGGRSYGGAQLYRGGSGRGRGGNNFSGSFRSDRPPQGNDSYRPQQNQYGPPSGRGGYGGYQGYPPPPPPGSWAGGFDNRGGGPPPPGNYGQWPPAPPPGVRLGNTYAGPPPGQSYNPRGGSYSGYDNRRDNYGRGGYGGGRGYSR